LLCHCFPYHLRSPAPSMCSVIARSSDACEDGLAADALLPAATTRRDRTMTPAPTPSRPARRSLRHLCCGESSSFSTPRQVLGVDPSPRRSTARRGRPARLRSRTGPPTGPNPRRCSRLLPVADRVVLGDAGEHLIECGPLARTLPCGLGLDLVLHQHGDRVNILQPLGDRDAAPRTVQLGQLGQLGM
jgi:hypothetical protein